MTLIRSLYVVSIALLVLAFVVFGLSALPVPESPEVPPELQSIEQYPTEEQQELLAEQQQEEADFQVRVSVYNQVVSFVIIGAAVGLLAGSILWLRGWAIIGDGVTLGAVFTLIYGLIYAYYVTAGVFSFLAVALGLLILLALLYRSFVRSEEKSE